MMTFLEILIIAANIPVLIWALLPFKRVPRFLDFMPLASVVIMIIHLLIDSEPLRFRMYPLYFFTIFMFLITAVRIFKHNPEQSKKKVPVVIGRIFGLLSLGFCVLIPAVVIPFYPLPAQTGEFNVGTTASDFTDTDRDEPYSEEDGVMRKIAVQFWYPTDRSGTEIKSDIAGAPVSGLQQKYPVVIFSHGAFGVRSSNYSTFRELASHGFIVVSIDHTYQAFYTALSDGSMIPVNTEFLNEAVNASNGVLSPEETFEITHNWLDIRTADIELVIESLKAGELGGEAELLSGHMDLTKIGLFGHSLGGASSAEAARNREDIGAVIVIDGTMIGDIKALDGDKNEILINDSFDEPLMLMYNASFLDESAKQDSYLPNINAYNNASADAYSVCIKNSGHLNFTDLPRISPLLSSMLGVGTVDSFKCIETVNSYCLEFFNKHLKGQESPLLDGENRYEGVVFEKR